MISKRTVSHVHSSSVTLSRLGSRRTFKRLLYDNDRENVFDSALCFPYTSYIEVNNATGEQKNTVVENFFFLFTI